MFSKKMFVSMIVLCVCSVQAADTRRLYSSTPSKASKDIDSVQSAIKRSRDGIVQCNSAPGRLSSDEQRPSDREVIVLEADGKAKKTFSESPVIRSKFFSKAPSSKKLFFISAEMLDDTLLLGLNQNRAEIKKIAQEHALKKSHFYTIIKGMRPEIVQSSPQIVMLANYFLYSIASTESCKAYLSTTPSMIPVPNRAVRFCVRDIQYCLDVVTKHAIQWPDVEREGNHTQYYKELLEKNKDIHVVDLAFPYYSAVVAIGMLSQIKDRALNLKERFSEVIASEKVIKKHCKVIRKQFEEMACFVPNLNIPFEITLPQDDEAQ